MYNPERDYAYITPTLMRIAIENLDAHEPAEKVDWRVDNNISQAEIAKIAEALALAQADFVNAADPVDSFETALERHGFFNFGYATRQFLFAAIGEVFCAAWFAAVREVSTVGEEAEAAADMARFTAAVRLFAASAGVPVPDVNYMAEYRKMQADVLRARVKALTAAQQEQRHDYHRLLSEFNALKKTQAAPPAKKSFWHRLFFWGNH
jgi:hypothetical protein